MSKISTGFLATSACGYLLLRMDKKYTKYFWLLGSGFVISVFVYIYILPSERFTDITYNSSLPVSIYSYIYEWSLLFNSNKFGFLSNFIGLIIITTYLIKTFKIRSTTDLKHLISTNNIIDLELILVISLLAFFASFFLSSSSDIYYFLIVPLNISVIYIGTYLMVQFNKFNSKQIILKWYLLGIVILSFVSRPDILNSYFYTQEIKNEYRQLTDDQQILQNFIADVSALKNIYNNKKIAIHIPHSESWYYHSQIFRPISSPFIVPAVTGITLISGIPEFIQTSKRKNYGFAYYRQTSFLDYTNIEKILHRARELNYEILIIYEVKNDNLESIIFEL